MTTGSDPDAGATVLDEPLRVGEAAARLGVAPSTVRSWGRRYGLVPEGRSPGGHRRYTAADMARLRRMQTLVDAGRPPARAAAEVMEAAVDGLDVAGRAQHDAAPDDDDAGPARGTGGPGGAVLAVPGAPPEARGLARAASRLDARAVGGILGDLLLTRGTVETWEGVLRPVLVAAGERWARTGTGIDVEHVLSEATVEALRAHRALQTQLRPAAPVLLACAPEDAHALPLHVVAAALAERSLPTQVLGARVPGDVVRSVTRRIGACAVLVWRQVRTDGGHDLDGLATTRPRLLVVAGGPGWEGCSLPGGTRRPRSLRAAVELLADPRRPSR